MGGIVATVRLRRGGGSGRICSTLIIGSVAWSGMPFAYGQTLPTAEVAAPSLRSFDRGAPAVAGARVPGASDPTRAAGGWSFDATAGSDFVFTDNVYLTNTDRLSDFIISPTASLTARRNTARSSLNANVDLSYDYYTKNTRLNGARPSALIDGIAEVVEDTLTIDARLATSVQQISSEDRTSAVMRNLDRNQTQILNYGISPTLKGRFTSQIDGEASYDFSSIRYLDGPVGNAGLSGANTTRHTGRARVGNTEASGAPLRWTVSGSYDRASIRNFGNRPPERANAEARGEYRLSAPLAFVARGGYDWVDEPTLRVQPDGAYGLAGFIWRPSNRTQVRAEVGYRYRDFNGEGSIDWQASQSMILSASYRRDIQTGQRILLDSLSGLGRDEFGNLVDPITGLPPDVNAVFFDVTNQAFKRDIFRFGMRGNVQRNFYSLSGDYERRRTEGGFGGESWGINGVLGRDITPRLQGSLTAGYTRTKSDAGLSLSLRDAKTTSAGARLDYELSRTMRTSLRYAHIRRETTLVRYRENAVVLSVSKVF